MKLDQNLRYEGILYQHFHGLACGSTLCSQYCKPGSSPTHKLQDKPVFPLSGPPGCFFRIWVIWVGKFYWCHRKKKNTWWHQILLSLQTCTASYARLQLLYEEFSVPFCAWRLIESSYYLWQKTAVYFWAWGSWESAVGVNQLSYSIYLWNRTKQCLGYEFPSQWDPPWYKMSELKKGQLMTLEYSFKLFANQYLFSGFVQGPPFPFIISHGA